MSFFPLKSACILLFVIWFSTSCSSEKKRASNAPTEKPFLTAAQDFMRKNMYGEGSLQLLDSALLHGEIEPMELVHSSRFRRYVLDSQYRAKFRDLIYRHAREWKAQIAIDEEPGERIEINVQVVDETTGKPIPNMKSEFVHADSSGNYSPEKGIWNPCIFAYLRSNKNGQYSLSTIKPGGYQAGDQMAPSHIHFTIRHKGYRPYGGEFSFDDDPIVAEDPSAYNDLIAQKVGESKYQVTILLQPE